MKIKKRVKQQALSASKEQSYLEKSKRFHAQKRKYLAKLVLKLVLKNPERLKEFLEMDNGQGQGDDEGSTDGRSLQDEFAEWDTHSDAGHQSSDSERSR